MSLNGMGRQTNAFLNKRIEFATFEYNNEIKKFF